MENPIFKGLLTVEAQPLDLADLGRTECAWKELSSQSTPNVFLRWEWIEAWLKHCAVQPICLRFSEQTQVFGLAIIDFSTFEKAGISWEQMNVHRSGNNASDQVWTEHNDVLAKKGYEAIVRKTLLAYFAEQARCDELRLGVSDVNLFSGMDLSVFDSQLELKTPAYRFRISPEFAEIDALLSSLSKNTRQQIRRSIRAYQSVGSLTLTFADTVEQALSFFNAAGEYHKSKWSDSGYHNKKFINFHHHLIKKGFGEGLVDLVKLSVSDNPIAYLYNLKLNGHVYFYLSGINYENTDNKLRPGLVVHTMAMSHYAKLDFINYDFLAGEARYKESLSNEKYEMALLSLKKRKFKFQIFKFLRNLYQIVK